MLYFVGYSSSEGAWTEDFNRAVRHELIRLKIDFIDLPSYDWRGPSARLKEYLEIDSTPADTWFIGWAQSPLIELIQRKKGRKYGLVVGLTEISFDPMVLTGTAAGLREQERLGIYDKIFANSHWCRECITRAYPALAGKVVTTGFPFDFSAYESYRVVAKEKGLVVFNQRFALERLHILELEVARQLIGHGYRVWHLCGIHPARLRQSSPQLEAILSEADRIGLKFIYNPDKDTYHKNLGKAEVVITTSIADMLPSSLIEAIILGAVPVAPRAFCFPEFVHEDNLYTPFDLAEITNIVERKPHHTHHVDQFAKERVVPRFLHEMGLL